MKINDHRLCPVCGASFVRESCKRTGYLNHPAHFARIDTEWEKEDYRHMADALLEAYIVAVPVPRDPGFEDHIVMASSPLDAKHRVAEKLGLVKIPFWPRQVTRYHGEHEEN